MSARYTVELSERELSVVREALLAYLAIFGHDEAETVRLVKAVIALIPEAKAA